MGAVWKNNQKLAVDYQEEPAGSLIDFVVDPSQENPTPKLGKLSTKEATAVLKRLDSMASAWCPQVSLMAEEGALAVIQGVRLLKAQPGVGEFRGIFSQGSNVNMRWLRPKDVGGAILRGTAAAGTLGLYGGGGGAVYTWLYSFTVNNTAHMVPSQTMSQFGALVYFGFMDPIETPPVEAWQLTLSGIAFTAEPADFKMIKTFNSNELPVVKFEKPVIVGPMVQQALDVWPWRTGDGKTQPVAVLIARAQDLLTL